jgi:hypothetical protein
VPFSEISFPGFLLRYFPEEKKLWLEKLNLLSIQSLSPFNWLKNSVSWKAALAYQVPADLCAFCHVLHFDGSVGLSQPVAGDQWRAYEFAGIYGDLGSALHRSWRAGPRVSFGIVGNATKNWKQQWEATLLWDLRRAVARKTIASASWNQSYFFSQEWEARLLAQSFFHLQPNAQSRNEIQSQLLFYF